MAPRVNTEDLLDAQGVADLLGLSQRTAVSVYQRRYPDMPKPVVVLSRGRTRLWLRSEIAAWAKNTGRTEAAGRQSEAIPSKIFRSGLHGSSLLLAA